MPINKVKEFEKDFLTELKQNHKDFLATFLQGKLSKEAQQKLKDMAAQMTAKYK